MSIRTNLSLNSVGQANIDFAYLKGVYARDVGAVLRKIAVLNSSSILDIGEDSAGLEVPVVIHGNTTNGLRVQDAASGKNVHLYHNGTTAMITASAGRIAISNSGAWLETGVVGASSTQCGISTGNLFVNVNKATASAPSGILGGTYFDTTLGKLRVYTGAAYETITSA